MNLQLSDGTVMQVPDDATPDAIRNYAARGEAHIKSNPAPAPPPQQGGADPNSFRNVVGRVTSDAVMGIPDLLIKASNLISRPGDWVAEQVTGEKPASQDLPALAPQLRKEWNVAELPEDAPYWQRIGEGAASGLPFGVLGAGRAALAGGAAGGLRAGATAGARELAANTLVPTITSDLGARAGGAIGGEAGELIGGLAGGMSPGGYKAAGENWVQGRYTGKGKANAPDIQAAADRLGIETTPGAIGNYDIQKRENAYAAVDPTGPSGTGQARIREDMTRVGEDIGTQRGGTGASPAMIGEDITAATADRLQADRDYSSAGQENLQRTIGDATQVPVTDIITEAISAMQSPNATVPMRDALRFRLERQLYPLIRRHPDGTPILDANGNATVPYGALKGWRSDLGRSFEEGGSRYGRARELYDPATRAMAGAAADAGIPRGDFNAVQSFTRGVEGAGGLAERLAPFDKESGLAHDYMLSKSGLKKPERLQTFDTETAGDPRQGNIYGSRIQQEVADTLGSGKAQSANKFAEFTEQTDPRALSTIAGPQLPRLQDLGTLARGVDVPTSQRGLGTSVAGVGKSAIGRWLGSEVLGHLFSAGGPEVAALGRGLGYMAKPTLDHIQQRIMNSEAARRGMLGRPMAHRMTIDDLARTLNIIGQSQPPGAQ